MEFTQFQPSSILKPYVDHFYVFKSNFDTEFEDTVFPSGNIEMIFNLGEGTWESLAGNKFHKTPAVELWGQITKPLVIKSTGKHTMIGIKFHPHAASCFFNNEIRIFNNWVWDLSDVMGGAVKTLHSQLLETSETGRRIELIENFLLKRLAGIEKKSPSIDKVAGILISLKKGSTEDSIGKIASNYGITPRYLHKLIHQYTGLSPKSFNRISRFQLSLKLIAGNQQPLTSIAYHCGYFDQSHFIRDFKSFTTVTPSAYLSSKFPVNQVAQQ